MAACEDDATDAVAVAEGRSRERVRSLRGVWQMYSVASERHDASPIVAKDSPHELLSASVQDIRFDQDRLVFASQDGTQKIEVQVPSEVSRHQSRSASSASITCNLSALDNGAEAPVRFEYETPRGRVIDERRVFRNGTRLEQKLSIVAKTDPSCQGAETTAEAVLEKRYFKRKSGTNVARAVLPSQQKLRLLGYLLLSQIPLMLVVPSRVWGSFLCAFHTVALFLVVFWSPVSRVKGALATSAATSAKPELTTIATSKTSSSSSSSSSSMASSSDSMPSTLVNHDKSSISSDGTKESPRSHVRSRSLISTTSSISSASSAPILVSAVGGRVRQPRLQASESARARTAAAAIAAAAAAPGSSSDTALLASRPEVAAHFKAHGVANVVVSISQLRRRKRSLSSYCEFELLVRRLGSLSTNGNIPFSDTQGDCSQRSQWTVWHKYSSILDFHNLLGDLLENENTRHSIFTRIVPPIPQQSGASLLSVTRSRRKQEDLLQRRMAGLDEFLVRVLGPEADPDVRFKALADVRVQRFLGLSPSVSGSESLARTESQRLFRRKPSIVAENTQAQAQSTSARTSLQKKGKLAAKR
ncbi:Hypothetical Protein FCC1311_107192 [Hondaea fermentalgiana]|uniref:PX domain-containing protein n=1 Tax=Hondaea fermentalgiana TaxID=2315210 RepID=A0A2R5GVA6_9STRA|nr:Hypothetical Protein FCC1311_107192 [Hondaea fermentalgiana]|eukprot:GBG34495.1 Hypothetical Protein FCC1311_107192 [Hondaea fermentalgiana]